MFRTHLFLIILPGLFLFSVSIQTALAKDVYLGQCFQTAILKYKEKRAIGDLSYLSISDDMNCSNLVNSLKPGDEIVFSDGNRFQLDRKLGRGSSAAIFALNSDPTVAIRIPLATGVSFYHMESFLSGWNKLTKLRFPAIQVIDPQNTSLEYQLVELVDFKFTFWQWQDRLWNVTAHRNLNSKPDFLKALNALTLVAEQSLLVAQVSDGLQMVFDGERWKMFDFGPESNSFIETPYGQNLFEKTIWDEELVSDEKLKERLRKIVLDKRAKLCEAILAARANAK